MVRMLRILRPDETRSSGLLAEFEASRKEMWSVHVVHSHIVMRTSAKNNWAVCRAVFAIVAENESISFIESDSLEKGSRQSGQCPSVYSKCSRSTRAVPTPAAREKLVRGG